MRLKTMIARGLAKTCGAKNRKGNPCECKQLFKAGRYRFHGGLSTGPRTAEGKAKAIQAMREGYRKWCERRTAKE